MSFKALKYWNNSLIIECDWNIYFVSWLGKRFNVDQKYTELPEKRFVRRDFDVGTWRIANIIEIYTYRNKNYFICHDAQQNVY